MRNRGPGGGSQITGKADTVLAVAQHIKVSNTHSARGREAVRHEVPGLYDNTESLGSLRNKEPALTRALTRIEVDVTGKQG